MKQRLDYIDYAKTVAISLICIGHFLPSGNSLKVILYSFHIPVFFFIAGYLYTSEAYGYKTFILKKAKRILIPYLFFFCISSLVYIVRPGITLKQWVKYLIFYNGQTIWISPLWFLPVIFVVSVVFFLIEKSAKKYRLSVVSLLTASCFLLTVLLICKGISIELFGINKVIHMLGYMGVGYLIRRLVDAIQNKNAERINRYRISLYATVVFAVFCLTAYTVNKGDNLSVLGCDYNNIFVYIPLAIIGSVSFTFMFFAFRGNTVSQITSANTLFIMSAHYFSLPVFRHFNIQSFGYCLLSGIACAAVMIVFCLIWSFICKKYKLVRLSTYAGYFGLLS